MLRALSWLSRRACCLLTGYDMTLCAYAHWRQDKRFWRCWCRVFDALVRPDRPHCQNSYKRRFP